MSGEGAVDANAIPIFCFDLLGFALPEFFFFFLRENAEGASKATAEVVELVSSDKDKEEEEGMAATGEGEDCESEYESTRFVFCVCC